MEAGCRWGGVGWVGMGLDALVSDRICVLARLPRGTRDAEQGPA